MKPADLWGPFALDLDPGERLARTRSLRAIVRLLTGPRGAPLAELLWEAEIDETVLPVAADALERLEPVDRRKVLASYAALGRPVSTPRRASPGVRAFTMSVVRVTPHPLRPRPEPRRGPPRLAA